MNSYTRRVKPELRWQASASGDTVSAVSYHRLPESLNHDYDIRSRPPTLESGIGVLEGEIGQKMRNIGIGGVQIDSVRALPLDP